MLVRLSPGRRISVLCSPIFSLPSRVFGTRPASLPAVRASGGWVVFFSPSFLRRGGNCLFSLLIPLGLAAPASFTRVGVFAPGCVDPRPIGGVGLRFGPALPGGSAAVGRARFPFRSLLMVRGPGVLPVSLGCTFRLAAATALFISSRFLRDIGAGPSFRYIQLSRSVLCGAGKATFHCASRGARLDGGSPS